MSRGGAFIRSKNAITCFSTGVLLGCTPELPAHQVDQVAPIWGYNGEITAVSIEGQNFFPAVAVDGTEDNGGRVDAQYEVALVGVDRSFSLTGVSLESYTQIDALVPQGLEPGLYDLVVRSPRGAEARLEQGFAVTDTRADHLLIEVDGVVHSVNDSVALELSLRDPDGNRVEQDIEVQLQVQSELQAQGVVIEDWGLEDAVELTDEVGVRGGLGPDGRTVVVLTSTIPDELDLVVAPTDEASIVRGGEAVLAFEAGAADQVEIILPTTEFTATAGESFDAVLRIVDEFGNVVDDQPSRVSLFEECGGFLKEVTVVGTLSTAIEVTAATSMQCPQNRVLALSSLEGRSEAFAVLPGPLERFEGERLDGSQQFTAGVVGPFRVSGRDRFGNAINLDGVDLSFEDSESSLASAECDLVGDGEFRQCSLVFEQAQDATALTLSGMSVESELGNFEVVSNVASQLLIGPLASTLVAGTLFELQVDVTDAWGNPVEVDEVQTPFSVSDGGFGTITCNSLGSQAMGTYVLSCSETFAAEAMQFTVENLGLGLAGASDIVEVQNASLDHVDLTATQQNVEAGEGFDLLIEAYDVFRNPYLQQSNPVLQLVDSAGGLSTSQAQLGSTGSVTVSGLRLSKTGDPVQLEVQQNGLVLGSLGFTVGHGAVDHLAVRFPRSWAWVGQATELHVEALDAFENLVLTFNEPVQLSSVQGGFISTSASGFQEGVLSTDLTWDTISLSDQVVVESDGMTGTSSLLDAVVGDCSSPPSAELLFVASGTDELVSCLNNGGVSTALDFSSSSAGDAPIFSYHLFDGTSSSQRSSTSNATLELTGVGGHIPELVVVDTAGCGSLADGVLWAAEDDGSVAGPVSLSSSVSSVTAGSSSQGLATLSVAAEDCAGDVASGAELYARASLGELDPSGTTLQSSGSGLYLTLDGLGTASFEFSALNTKKAEVAVISVGVLNNASYTELGIDVVGDNAQPRVTWVDPQGRTEEVVTQVDVGFSEAIESTTLGSSTISLNDSLGDSVDFEPEFSTDGRELSLLLTEGLDASLDSYELTIGGDLRDKSGNFLDGDWSGDVLGTDAVVDFGDVVDDGITTTACSLASDSFRPDGDAGTDAAQADEARVSVSSSSRAAYWLMEVRDGGTLIRTVRQETKGVSDLLRWDGRSYEGPVVSPGAYQIQVSAMDSQGNLDAGCTTTVEVEQAYTQPERQP